ncbi:uroporphyrinogen-III C-methyltransferase [Calidifontibacillus erzurumensis]|uniref:Uroporphyrinogen-III C-methyltransferase n=1 Tax=Calidifontibacillus erzurumensis TaxID=2741433 RepID=A0A8J8GBE3_9BACI|nr:uroporphyrinogen-III C-methyltransferase [Calidifontibacillus erzurumensis]NSL50689.1 uroporphyrinogen-III C-methyltransferase [Calidifontibacillus erzurumensis]
MNKGKVYIVGAGPGHPKLITIRGMECIKEADVIIYDRLINKELLNYASSHCQLIYCGKVPREHGLIQEEINTLLVEHAKKGKIVTRLKGGDPFVFGRGAEEAEVLRNHHIPYEIVPGITAGIAAPAYAGIPVTHRNYASSLAIVTAHGKLENNEDHLNWQALAQGIDTLAFYMGVGNLQYICDQLKKHGRPETTPVAIIQWGTTNMQKTVISTLDNITEKCAKENITNPAMIIIGDVVNLREKIHWFEEMIIK